MARTYLDLIAEVRAVVAVDDDQAFSWLLDRSRVLNAESSWLWTSFNAEAVGDPDGRYYFQPDDLVWLEAVTVGDQPYHRSTPAAMDARWAGWTSNVAGIYAAAPVSIAQPGWLQIHPPTISPVTFRYVQDVWEEEDRTMIPPFPTDFEQSLIDGAIAIGLGRMDERFDSANYFEQRFFSAVDRLKRRRHAQAGRGATAIRIVQ